MESDAMKNLPEWQTMPRPMITADMMNEVSLFVIFI